MPKFLTIASYTAEGTRALMKEGGTKRREAVEKAIETMGGRMEAFYYGFGDGDAYVISEAPDNASVAAISMAVNASGVVTARTVILMTAEEIDAATAKKISYRAPGQ